MDQIIFFYYLLNFTTHTHSNLPNSQQIQLEEKAGTFFLNAAGAPQLYNIDDADGILKIILKLSTKDQQN